MYMYILILFISPRKVVNCYLKSSSIFFAFQQDLNDLAALIRTDLSKVTRKILIALITIDVHARDTIENLIKHKCFSR